MTPSLSMRAAWQQVAAEAEATCERHTEGDFYYSWDTRRQCNCCTSYWPCREYEAADRIRVTALAQINALNEAGTYGPVEARYYPPMKAMPRCRLIPDPAVLLAESPRPDKAEEVPHDG